VVAENHCALVNNVWNRAAAGGAFHQEIFTVQSGGRPIDGWRWSAPWHFFPRVVSQPQLVCGDKPWDAPSRLRSDFPFRAGSRRLTARFQASLRASGVYNLAFTLWAVSSLPPSKSAITHEIMVWTVNHGQDPAGTHQGALDVNGVTYDAYVERQHRDASGANANVWMYVAFVARRPVLNGPLDLDAFVAYLLQQGLISKNHFITSVELGDEVSQGAGIVELRDFSLCGQE
jgi:Glycosyl hydrolase family 12